ncbi:MAG: hypothetical protein ACFFAS_03970, partial [Promethearchaeota archaeon]
MISETIEALQILANIIAAIINFIKPFVIFIGDFMVNAINYLLALFPRDSHMLYIVIFIILIVLGVLVNTSPLGDKLKEKFNKFDEKHFKKYGKSARDKHEEKTLEEIKSKEKKKAEKQKAAEEKKKKKAEKKKAAEEKKKAEAEKKKKEEEAEPEVEEEAEPEVEEEAEPEVEEEAEPEVEEEAEPEVEEEAEPEVEEEAEP